MKRFAAQAVLGAVIVAGCSSAVGSTRVSRIDARIVPTATCRAASAARVQWVGPVEPAEQARLDSWCAAVGPVLLHDRLAPVRARLDDVLFVSWNVHVGAAEIERFVADLRSGLFSEGRRPGHVVLMLQEAVRSGDVPHELPAAASTASRIGPTDASVVDIGHLSEQLQMSLFYVPSMRNGAASSRYAPTDRGNAILSTVPLSNPMAIELPGEGQRRVAVTATMTFTVDGESVPLAIGAAHLSTRGPSKTLWVFGATGLRRRQARSLVAALTSGPMVLGADLNSWMGGPDEPAARDLQRAFPATPNGRRQATASAGLILDYMFFRPPPGWRARLVRAPERYGSDHYPLIGWLDPS